MNKSIVKVPKIRSYQTLVYKNGSRTFRKKEYKDYKELIGQQLIRLEPISGPYSLDITFISRTKTIGDLDNIIKPISDILEDISKVDNDKLCHELIGRKQLNRELDQDLIIIKLKGV